MTPILAPLLACAILLVPSALFAQPVERPTLKPGDSWTYRISARSPLRGSTTRDHVREVKQVSDERYVLSAVEKSREGGDEVRSSPQLSGDLNPLSKAGEEWQEFKWLQWPLEPGRRWSFEQKGTANVFTWNSKVDGWEQVTVPAGTFKALRISSSRSGPTRGSASETVWYAPEVKAVVKRISERPGERAMSVDETLSELVAFKVD